MQVRILRGAVPAPRTAAAVVGEQVRQIDVMPTLLDVAGIEPPATFEGRSFRAGLDPAAGAVEPREAYIEEPHYHRLDFAADPSTPPTITNELIAWRTGDYKYILDAFTGAEELYHVGQDPRETVNLIGREAQRGAEMRAKLLAFATALLDRADSMPPPDLFDMHEDFFGILKSLGYIRETPPVPPDWTAPSKAERIRALAQGGA